MVSREWGYLSKKSRFVSFVLMGRLFLMVAELYGVETRALNQAVKRNISRFTDDILLQLTKDESECGGSERGLG